jgi:citrate lyase subunit beta/citryl-CoA lyase
MSTVRPRRSVLYMPGSNARALEKARTLPADGIILDLEDAVAPEAKADARRQVVEAVKAGGFGPREVVVRINGLGTAWGLDDLEAAVSAGPDAVLVPKIEHADEVLDLGRRLDELGVPETVALWAMMETPRALLNAESIAAVRREHEGRRLSVFVMGTNDLAKETRARLLPGRAAFVPMLVACLLAARTTGIELLDGVYNGIRDAAGFRAECEQGRDLGLDGKTLIHPDQIGPANAVFAPSAEEVATAEQIIAAFAAPDAAGKGVLQVGGKMVERMHAEMAGRTVTIARAIAAAQG